MLNAKTAARKLQETVKQFGNSVQPSCGFNCVDDLESLTCKCCRNLRAPCKIHTVLIPPTVATPAPKGRHQWLIDSGSEQDLVSELNADTIERLGGQSKQFHEESARGMRSPEGDFVETARKQLKRAIGLGYTSMADRYENDVTFIERMTEHGITLQDIQLRDIAGHGHLPTPPRAKTQVDYGIGHKTAHDMEFAKLIYIDEDIASITDRALNNRLDDPHWVVIWGRDLYSLKEFQDLCERRHQRGKTTKLLTFTCVPTQCDQHRQREHRNQRNRPTSTTTAATDDTGAPTTSVTPTAPATRNLHFEVCKVLCLPRICPSRFTKCCLPRNVHSEVHKACHEICKRATSPKVTIHCTRHKIRAPRRSQPCPKCYIPATKSAFRF